MNFTELEKKVIKWGEDRDLYKESTIEDQLDKLEEEFDELLNSESRDEDIDAIGDMMVVMTHITKMLDITLTTCYATAYNEIKDRKGKMVNGLFVKEG